MYLFDDCETNGFPNKNLPPEHEQQSRIVQLAALLTDEVGNTLAEMNVLIQPCGWTISPKLVLIHGITTEMCREKGVPLAVALGQYIALKARCKVNIGHNKSFDDGMLEISYAQACVQPSVPTEIFCTMLSLTEHCKLPGRYGNYKWPKLQEAYKWAFGKEFEDAHDAMADLTATKDLFFEMKKRNLISL